VAGDVEGLHLFVGDLDACYIYEKILVVILELTLSHFQENLHGNAQPDRLGKHHPIYQHSSNRQVAGVPGDPGVERLDDRDSRKGSRRRFWPEARSKYQLNCYPFFDPFFPFFGFH